MPKAVAERDPAYIDKLRSTAGAVASQAGLAPDHWQFAYQSAGHTPVEWLTPDVKDLFPSLRRKGKRAVLIAPVQFLSDHLEVLYDIDIAAREEALAAGMDLRRCESLNDSALLARALAGEVLSRRPAEVGR
jgi:ferrochelatase